METENRGKPQKESLVHLPGFGERAGHFGSKGTDLIAHTRGFKQDDETFRLMESQSDVAARNRYINRTTRPLMSTDRWTNLTTAASILEAVEQPGVKWFEWSDAKNRYTNASLRESAGETTYNIHTKRALEQIFKHLGLKMPQVEKTLYGFRIPLSEEFIELVKKHGVSALGVAGLLGATQAEKEEGKSRPLIPGGS